MSGPARCTGVSWCVKFRSGRASHLLFWYSLGNIPYGQGRHKSFGQSITLMARPAHRAQAVDCSGAVWEQSSSQQATMPPWARCKPHPWLWEARLSHRLCPDNFCRSSDPPAVPSPPPASCSCCSLQSVLSLRRGKELASAELKATS